MATSSFRGTSDYIASPDLQAAVNVAVSLERPLLVRGEPGTGKTLLAEAVAEALGMRLITWPVKSTTRAQDGLYVYDTVQRLYDSQFGEGDPADVAKYIRLGQLGEAFSAPDRVVLVIDEVDKADLEFPNDLLWELDGLQKRPSTSELVDWVQALAVAGVDPGKIVDELPFMGVVLKKQADLDIARRHMAIRARRAAISKER